MLQGKNVLLGISGSIAAYKSANLCRLLIKQGANVKVLMTPDSVHFITPLTLSTLSKNPVYSDYFDPKTGEWSNHVDLAKWADFFLLAPATANTLAKMANGICDNLLLATYFSMEKTVFFAPAMDLDMYRHPANKTNIKKLISFGNQLIPAGKGELASGLHGEGRMAEEEDIIKQISGADSPWKGKKVLVTAGPTIEAIDPVRYIGNHSSGKMGLSLAKEALRRGAEVCLIHGPISLDLPAGMKTIAVQTAAEMHKACLGQFAISDVIIMSAAVADYRPKTVSDQKIKKANARLEIELEPTVDILADLGKQKKESQVLVGFALETENEEEHAKLKLEKKNLDLIVLNSLQDKGAGFGTDTNKVKLIDASNKLVNLELMEKAEVSKQILDYIQNITQ